MIQENEKNMPDISIVIPTYNVERYITECLDSILGQTFDNFEVICIDDGSTDGTAGILKQYEKSDSRIRVFLQDNCGAGAARNKGIDLANGQYLYFLDSDDFTEAKMLETFYRIAHGGDADVVVCRCKGYDELTSEEFSMDWCTKAYLLPRNQVFNYKDCPKYIFQAFTGWAWDKFYKTAFVKENKLLFQTIRTSNDLSFVYSSLIEAERMICINDVLVHHRSHRVTSLENTRAKSAECFYSAAMNLKEKLQDNGSYLNVKRSYDNWVLDFILWNLRTLPDDIYAELLIKLKQEYFDKLEINNIKSREIYDRFNYQLYLKIKSDASFDIKEEYEKLAKSSKVFRYNINYTIKYIAFKIQKMLMNGGKNENSSSRNRLRRPFKCNFTSTKQ